jgi:hypothetical protein
VALLILLSVEDEQEALDIAEQWENKGLVGIYKKPTMFCDGEHGGRKTEVGFTKGQKYGWWVCAKCRKPKKRYWDNVLSGDPMFGPPEAFNLIRNYFVDSVDEESNV